MVCLQVVWIELEGGAVGGGGLVQPSFSRERDAQTGMVRRRSGVDRDRLGDQVSGHVMASRLVGDDPEQVQAVGMAGVDRENLPIQAFRVAQPPCLMMSNASTNSS